MTLHEPARHPSEPKELTPPRPAQPQSKRPRAWVLGLLAAMAACSPQPRTSAIPSAASAAAAGAAEVTAVAVPLDPAVVTGVLDNGLTYFLRQHESEEKRVHLMLAVKAGSLHEADDQRGLAHFVEHMAFNGTRRFEKQAMLDLFERSGVRFGSHVNATTQYDRTTYQVSVATDDPQMLATGLNVLEDWASGVSFAPEEVQKERPVVLAEWNSAQGAARRVGEQQRKLLLAGSKYVEREPIGDRAVLENAPVERLVDFYRRWYRPERMALIVVGDIDPKSLEPVVVAQFSRLQAPAGAADNLSFAIPVSPEPRAAVISDPETPASIVLALYKAKARLIHFEEDHRARVVNEMGVLMLRRRLHEVAQSPKAPFTAASSELSSAVFGQLNVVSVSARAKEKQVQASANVLLLELERVRRHGFTSGELERTKADYARLLEHSVAARATAEGMALAQALANHFVTGDALPSPEYLHTLGTRLLPEITVAEVSQGALHWLTESERLLIASGASRDVVPEQAELLAALSGAEKLQVTPYVEAKGEVELLTALPEPGSIVKEESIGEIGVKVWTLSNGARVVLKPTPFKDDEIVARAISPGGTSRASDAEFPSARFASELVAISGLGQLDRPALNRFLSGKVVRARPWISELDEGIEASSTPKDVETLFQLIHLYATAPRRDESAFEAFRAATREDLRNRDLNPGVVFSDATMKELWKGHARRSPPALPAIDAIDLKVALEFYQQRFADMSDFHFVLVGEIDEATFKPLVERYLASLPGTGRKESHKDLGLHRKRGVAKVRVQQGKDDKATATLIYHGETPWSENAHTDLNSLVEYLQIRVREVLREELGGVYTPRVVYSFERLPYENYTVAVYFDCKPGDVDKLRSALDGVIADVKKSGVEDRYLEKLRSQRTRELEEAYRTNGFWLARLVDKYRMGEDPRDVLILHDLTKRVTSDNIRAAARRFLRGDQYLDALLTPAPAQ